MILIYNYNKLGFSLLFTKNIFLESNNICILMKFYNELYIFIVIFAYFYKNVITDFKIVNFSFVQNLFVTCITSITYVRFYCKRIVVEVKMLIPKAFYVNS